MDAFTTATTLGLADTDHHGASNIPPYHVSTMHFPTVKDYYTGDAAPYPIPTYGAYGTPSSAALEQAYAALEGAERCIVTSSGVSAITTALLAFLQTGDHLLMADTVYGPTRQFATDYLTRLGVETEFYDPLIGRGIAGLIRPNTRLIFAETPGSLTFEVQDIPAIAQAAKAKGVLLMVDSTWASPLLWRPFDLGVDITVASATKYTAGHSDLVMGIIGCREAHAARLTEAFRLLGGCSNGGDCFLALRGLRTLPIRLKQQEAAALKIAQWLKARPEVATLLHPAFEDCPGHAVWKRDFTGSNGLFSIVLKEKLTHARLAALIEPMQYFRLGYSWGGFQSLLIPFHPETIRTATPWPHKGTPLRLHIGLQAVEDLIGDLEAGFGRL